jgi:hypothetical protein
MDSFTQEAALTKMLWVGAKEEGGRLSCIGFKSRGLLAWEVWEMRVTFYCDQVWMP